MNREYHRWTSPHLGRDMEMLVFGHAGAKVLVFPTRDGRFYEYENIGMVRALAPRIEAGELQLFCVDSIDHESFYCFWCRPQDRIRRHEQFEAYLLHDVLPMMAARNDHPVTIAHGCSLGAFHAANFAFRHPRLIQRLLAFSGRYDLTAPIEHFRDLFDGHYDDGVYFHMPNHYLPGLSCPDRMAAIRRMSVTLVIGGDDPFYASTVRLRDILAEKGVSVAMPVWDGRAHQGGAWRRMAELYF